MLKIKINLQNIMITLWKENHWVTKKIFFSDQMENILANKAHEDDTYEYFANDKWSNETPD